MWVSKKEFNALTERVEKFEKEMEGRLEYKQNRVLWFYGKGIEGHAEISLEDVMDKILHHLKLTVTKTEKIPARVELVKKKICDVKKGD